MNQNNATVKGYFVVLGDERKSLKNKSSLDAGRAGIFYKKEDLVSTIKSKAALKKVPMDVIEIAVPPCCITHENKEKFGVKKGGEDISIMKIQSFKEAAKEIMMAEVA